MKLQEIFIAVYSTCSTKHILLYRGKSTDVRDRNKNRGLLKINSYDFNAHAYFMVITQENETEPQSVKSNSLKQKPGDIFI